MSKQCQVHYFYCGYVFFVNQQRIGRQFGSIQKCGYFKNGMWGLFKRRILSETLRTENHQSTSDIKITVIKLIISIFINK